MSGATLEITPTVARRIAVTRQHLAGPQSPANATGIMEVARDLGCLQLDPTNAVAPNHLLVLWSRLGPYDPADLEALRWEERQLFEYWAHAASLVLTEDYPIHHHWMTAHTDGPHWSGRAADWMEQNHALRDGILGDLAANGPMMGKQFKDVAVVPWASTGWTNNQNVSRMLGFLNSEGLIMVAGRKGGQRLWDLSDHWLPAWTPREELSDAETVRLAAQRALRALGVARADQINLHFTRDHYPGLEAILAEMVAERLILPVSIGEGNSTWPGAWYIHSEDVPLSESLLGSDWQPRTTLLSPFDNLIADRARNRIMWDFDFKLEIYVPKDQRQYGYFVMPILHGERLIGRIDPIVDRKRKVLQVNAIHLEPATPNTPEIMAAIDNALAELATFVGASDIEKAT